MLELFSKTTHHSLINFRAAKLYEIIKEFEACFNKEDNIKKFNKLFLYVSLGFLWLAGTSLIIGGGGIAGYVIFATLICLLLIVLYLGLKGQKRKFYFFIFYYLFGFWSNLSSKEIAEISPVLEKIPYAISRHYIDHLVSKQRISFSKIAKLYLFLITQSNTL